jgi:cAMP-dependent protein kinase regulator
VDSGNLTCSINGEKVKEYQNGEAFGELALLYNAPRAASIISEGECSLYALDRNTFNYIVKDAAIKKRERYDAFLRTVEILTSMNDEERIKIADALKPLHFKSNQYVVKEVIF